MGLTGSHVSGDTGHIGDHNIIDVALKNSAKTDAAVQYSASANLVAADASREIESFGNTSGITLTIPANLFPVGTRLRFRQMSTGSLTVAVPTGVTINSFRNAVSTMGQYGTLEAVQRAANAWIVTGDLGFGPMVIRLNYSNGAYPPRVGPFGCMFEYVGPVDPSAQMTEGDTWIKTAS